MEAELCELAERHGAEFIGFQAVNGCWKLVCTPENLRPLAEELNRNNTFWCDVLQCLSAEHQLLPEPCMLVHYHLQSLPRNFAVHLSCRQPMESVDFIPGFPSITDLWKTAAWHEREAAELFGIHFEGHPDLRKLLLPDDWNGFPMRKDYQPDETYHGLRIRFES